MIRPCAEMTRTCRFTRNRSRMIDARLSSTSDRLPPASRCVSTAVTKNRASMNGNAIGERLQRLRQRHAEVLLIEQQPELRTDRLGHLVGDHRQPGRERMAGAQRAGEQIDRLGKLLLELDHPPVARHLARADTAGTTANSRRPPARPAACAGTASRRCRPGRARHADASRTVLTVTFRPDCAIVRCIGSVTRPMLPSSAVERADVAQPLASP